MEKTKTLDLTVKRLEDKIFCDFVLKKVELYIDGNGLIGGVKIVNDARRYF